MTDGTLHLRRAESADIAFMMQAERGPGFDRLVGQSSADTHAGFLAAPDTAVLIAARDGTDGGFMILSGIGDPHNGVCMKRIVSATPDGGFGTAMVRAGIAWIFANTNAHRIWLDTLRHNARAAHVYRKLGFIDEGIFRDAYRLPDGTYADRIVMSILKREWR